MVIQMVSQPKYLIVEYAKNVIKWCESKDITSFYQKDLPEELQSLNAGMLRAAAARGFFRRGNKDPKSRVAMWHIVQSRRISQ